jgi:hypothetical protein
MRCVLAVVIGAAVAAVVACSSKQTVSPTAPVVTSAGMSSQRTRIDELDKKIDEAFAVWNTPRPPAPPSQPDMLPAVASTQAKPSADPACKPGSGETCSDTCTLADSICDNANDICKIAAELGDDAYAKGKCASGQASCKAAHDRCCGCL